MIIASQSSIFEQLLRKSTSAGTKSSVEINPLIVTNEGIRHRHKQTKIQDNHRRYDKKCYCDSKYGMYGQTIMSYVVSILGSGRNRTKGKATCSKPC